MPKAKRQKWPPPKYTEAQKKWCDDYESWTGFEPLMGDYEEGRRTFEESPKSSVRLYEMHTMDMHLRVSSMSVPE